MGEWPQGGFRASLSLRARAAKALRAYRRAEARLHELQKRKDALAAEERVILHIWAVKASKSAYMSLSERRAEMFEPWKAANADLVLAYEQAQHVLRDMRPCASPGEIVTEKMRIV